jgi:hypothetical protein
MRSGLRQRGAGGGEVVDTVRGMSVAWLVLPAQLAQYEGRVREASLQARDASSQLRACTEALQAEREARDAAVQRRDQLQVMVGREWRLVWGLCGPRLLP